MEKYKAIIVDDHTLFRKGMIFMLNEINNINVCGEAESGTQFINMLKTEIPDIVLMDIEMPEKNGIETTLEAINQYPDLKVLAISMHSDEDYYYKMVDAGVKGFIRKNASFEELEHAVLEIISGGTYFSIDLLRNIIVNINENKKNSNNNEQILDAFTEREKEVVLLLCKGFSNKEISEKLFISPRTVDKHRSNLFAKYNLKNAIQLVIFALKNNLIDIKDI